MNFICIFCQSPIFWLWIVQALFESVMCVYLPITSLINSDPRSGAYETYWQAGALTFTAVVLVTNEKVIRMESSNCFLSRKGLMCTGQLDDEQILQNESVCMGILHRHVDYGRICGFCFS
jgi:hypothetical protein